ncbi:lecithin retinol acyltransferase-like [Denticeps clupeoides]|uniref:LRAT domain-containing protein n=1 Tax=Denticeps clupeoides TaxID=299321 RepID=A0AAY4CVU0_9TELE|nr:lecithin retinol acyltransferase-like [Denticeps clupeoides]
MLDSLTFLLEKVFLIAHLNVFRLILSDKEKKMKQYDSSAPPPLQRGDLLEVPRTLFIHFGIYLGDNKVAHMIPDITPVLTSDKARIQKVVTNKRLLMGVLYKHATIRVDSVEDFAYGSPILLNAMDKTFKTPALPNEEVARRAEKLVGPIAYSLLWNNCEHFATHCRYGAAVSLQTDKFCEWLKSIIRDQRSVLFTTFFAILSIIYLEMALSSALPTLLIPFTLWMAG